MADHPPHPTLLGTKIIPAIKNALELPLVLSQSMETGRLLPADMGFRTNVAFGPRLDGPPSHRRTLSAIEYLCKCHSDISQPALEPLHARTDCIQPTSCSSSAGPSIIARDPNWSTNFPHWPLRSFRSWRGCYCGRMTLLVSGLHCGACLLCVPLLLLHEGYSFRVWGWFVFMMLFKVISSVYICMCFGSFGKRKAKSDLPFIDSCRPFEHFPTDASSFHFYGITSINQFNFYILYIGKTITLSSPVPSAPAYFIRKGSRWFELWTFRKIGFLVPY